MRDAWEHAPVGEVGDVQLGRQRSPATDAGPHMVPYLRVANVFDGTIDYSDVNSMNFSPSEQERYFLQPGDILLNEGQSLDLVGRSAVFDGPARTYCFQNTLVRFRPGPRTSSSFARAVFKRWLDTGRFTTIAKQTTSIAHLGADRFARLAFPLPPLGEQQRIAETLDTVDDAIRNTEEIVAKLKQVKQGLLHDLLTRGIDDSGELRDPERHPEQFRGSVLGRIPKQWDVARCDDVCTEITVGIVVRPTQYYRDEGVPVLRSANVREDGIVRTDLKFMSSRDHAVMSKTSVVPGDVLSVRTGYPGTTAVVPADLPTANCVDLIITRTGPLLDAQFFALWVNSDSGKGQVLRRQGGLAQQHFNVGEMKALLAVVPPVTEQRAIAQRASEVSGRLATERAEVAKLRLLKQGLMDDLLTGRVRVAALAGGRP